MADPVNDCEPPMTEVTGFGGEGAAPVEGNPFFRSRSINLAVKGTTQKSRTFLY